MKVVIRYCDMKWKNFSEPKLKIKKLFLRIFLGIEYRGNQVACA